MENSKNDSMDKVTGGYVGDYSGQVGKEGSIRCDNCYSLGGVPVNGGHLCFNCLKKLKDLIGAEALGRFLA